MLNRWTAGLGLLGAGVVLASASLTANQPQSGEYMLDFDMNQGQQAWMESMQPGKFHAFMGKFIGEWDTEFQMYMDPGAEPMVTKGTSSISWKYEGKWIAEDNEASFMGQPMNSFLLMGYDNVKRQFVGSLIDSMSTEMKSFKGGLSPDGKVLTMYGEMDEPITGEHGKMVKYQTFIEDDDNHVMEVSEILYGEPFVVVRIKYTRSDR